MPHSPQLKEAAESGSDAPTCSVSRTPRLDAFLEDLRFIPHDGKDYGRVVEFAAKLEMELECAKSDSDFNWHLAESYRTGKLLPGVSPQNDQVEARRE